MHALAVPGSLQQPEFHRALPYCPIQAIGHLWATLFSPRSKQGYHLYFALAGSFALCLAESNLMLPQRLFFSVLGRSSILYLFHPHTAELCLWFSFLPCLSNPGSVCVGGGGRMEGRKKAAHKSACDLNCQFQLCYQATNTWHLMSAA